MNVESDNGSRRAWIQNQVKTATVALVVASTGGSTFNPPPAYGASLPTPDELSRLQKGHARVKYLLNNWDVETQVCGKLVMSDTERKQVVRTEG